MNRTILFAVLASACVFRTDMTIEHSDVEIGTVVDDILLDIHAGTVTVVVGDVDKAQVNRILRYGHNPPDVDVYTVGATLVVEARCPSLAGQCSADHEIVLPKSASFEGYTGSGDVNVMGLTDDVKVETGSGDVQLDEIEGLISVETGSGDVVGRDLLTSSILIETGSGDVDLHIDAQPNDVFVNTGSGDVYTELPEGAYRVKTSTGSGDVSVDGIFSDSSAPDHIEIGTGSGDIKIRGI